MSLNLLFIGDVVGSPGRRIIHRALPGLVRRENVHLVVCNAENAAGGSGLTAKCFDELREAGVGAITLGDHAFRKDEVFALFERESCLCRPANYPTDAPGHELVFAQATDGEVVAAFCLLGRTFMKPVDCPYRTADRLLERIGGATRCILVDVHAEATSEKQSLARYLDGRVSAVLGTHTHVPTADECLLPDGTAYQTDVGMTGPYESIIGRAIGPVLASTLSHVPRHFDVAKGDPRLHGSLVALDPMTGRASSIRRVSIDDREARALERGG